MSYDKYQVKEALELEDVFSILESLQAEPEMHDDYITALTICHGGDSRKLYYYDNTKLLRCYSGSCGSMDIFELIQKVKGFDLNEAVYYVVQFFNLQYRLEEVDESDTTEDWKILRKWQELSAIKINYDKVVLPEFDRGILKHYPQPRIKAWEKEHISKEVCDFFDIRYDPINGGILIPHVDEDNRLIGIRERTLVQENEVYGKYRPWKHGPDMFNHPLAFNLYGYYQAKDNIRSSGVAIVMESEKSVLQLCNYLGLANNIGVAMCGSSLSKYQLQMLLDAGANEICIGFDADYENLYDNDWKQFIDKMEKFYFKYNGYVNISFLVDKTGKELGYKNSPTDCGKETFMKLWRDRVFL